MNTEYPSDIQKYEAAAAPWRRVAAQLIATSKDPSVWEIRGPTLDKNGLPMLEFGYVTVLDMLSRSKRRYILINQFQSDDSGEQQAVAWLEKFGDSSAGELVDLLRVNCALRLGESPGKSVELLLRAFIVDEASVDATVKMIEALSLQPKD